MTPALDLVWFVTGANVELGFRRGAVVDAVVVIYSRRTDEIYGCVAQAEKENEGHRRGKERKRASKQTNKQTKDTAIAANIETDLSTGEQKKNR
jgi:hypothetical protein